MEYINVKNLSFYYEKEPVLENINLTVESGQFITLTGENGTAKTTLVKIMLGILKPKAGVVTLAQKNIFDKELKISYLPQQIASFNAGFPSTVYEFVKSGLFRKGSWFKKVTEEDKRDIQKNLEAVNMWEFREKKIGELSGGQKQRIVIARMLTSKADIYILDEPTTGMDEKTRILFYNLLEQKVSQEKITILMITHDNEVVEKFAHKNIHLCKSENSSWCCNFYAK